LQEHMAFIEAQGPLALRAEAHALLADVVLRTSSPAQLRARRADVERHLTAAHKCSQAAEWWGMSERTAILLSMARKVCADEEGCDVACRKALAVHEQAAQQRQSCIV
jgi:hypothetical protein